MEKIPEKTKAAIIELIINDKNEGIDNTHHICSICNQPTDNSVRIMVKDESRESQTEHYVGTDCYNKIKRDYQDII